MSLERLRFYPQNIINEKIPPVPDNFWGRVFSLLYDKWGDPYWWPGRDAWEVSVGAILTQNTSWNNVEKALENLRLQKVISPLAINQVPSEKLAELIRPSGYFNQKTKKLKALAGWWLDNVSENSTYKGEADKLRNELLNIWGIGPETADSIACYAFGNSVFVVDAYTKRLLQRFKNNGKNYSYDSIQEEVHLQLPASPKLFNFLHGLIVVLAKGCCTKRTPKCTECPLSNTCKHFRYMSK